MKEFFKINNIDVGFANHNAENFGYLKGALNTEVIVRQGKLRISLVTPALEITDEMHNGLLADADYDDLRNIDYFRMVTYYDLAIENGQYNTQVICPYDKNLSGFETYNFPEDVRFYGIIDVQEGYIHLKGELKSRLNEDSPSIPVEALKCFEPKPLLPKRKEYSWNEALKANPLEVYDLSLQESVFNEFPKQLLGFKNLESLWVGVGAQFNFKTFPDAFYQLIELRKLVIYTSNDIETISAKINQLQKLEELTINHSQLTALPDEICELPQLETLDFSYNRLTCLPQNITLLPNLKELSILGNSFKALPKNLSDIDSLTIDRKHRKLIIDVSYKSKNPNAIDTTLYDLSQYPKEQDHLAKAISALPELKAFKDIIIDYSTMATYLTLDKERADIPLGASKVGGSPDLPADWEHPADKNGLLNLFHAQLNCEEIAPCQHYLPRKGMLYFFVNDEEFSEKPIVLYAENTENLVRRTYSADTQFSDGDYDALRNAVAVHFENAVSLPVFYNIYNHGTERYPKYASFWENPENEAQIDQLEDYDTIEKLQNAIKKPIGFDNGHMQLDTHSSNASIFTQHESPQEQAAAKFGGEPIEWLVLLTMESIDQFNFWDAGTLSYCIHKKDLAIQDFSRISSSIESS